MKLNSNKYSGSFENLVGFKSEEIKKLESALVDNETVLYRVKVIIGETNQRSIVASVPLCSLQASSFKDRFVFTLNDKQELIHIGFFVENPVCDSKPTEFKSFSTSVSVVSSIEGPR